MALDIGQFIEGKYRIVRLIGEGGMGSVFEGENVRIGRRVAIKVLHTALTGNKEVVQRFQREAQAAGRIGSDHIMEVIDLGELPDGDHFMVMEYLDGEPLSVRIGRLGCLTPEQLVPIAKQLLRGLGAAHRAGIIHRDLKPDNVFILWEKANLRDFVKIIDFGISKFQSRGSEGMKMTRTGMVMGTPYYMSPEQASGSREADCRSDIYSVGVILYEAITGRVPFEATSFNQLMFKIVLSEIPPPQSLVPDLSPGFASIVLKAMGRDLESRFQTAEEFVQAIEAWELGAPALVVPLARGPGPLATLTQEWDPQETLARSEAASADSRPGTAGNWARSSSDSTLIKHGALPRALAIAAGILALGAGGVVAGYKLWGGTEAPERGAATSADAMAPRIQASRLSELPLLESSPLTTPSPVVFSAMAPPSQEVPASSTRMPGATPYRSPLQSPQKETDRAEATHHPGRTSLPSTGRSDSKSKTKPASTNTDFGY